MSPRLLTTCRKLVEAAVLAVPSPKLDLAVLALSRSLRLLVEIKTLVGSVLSILSILALSTEPPISALMRR